MSRLLRRTKRFLTVLIWGGTLTFNAHAQQAETIDYTGVLTKFDTSFDGIGPKVYLLPHPPTQRELIDSAFLKKEAIGLNALSALHKMFFMTGLKGNVKQLGSWSELSKHTGPKQSAEGWLIQEIERVTPLGNPSYLADLQNLLACEYARIGLNEIALPLFETALATKLGIKQMTQAASIRFNLASLYAYQQQWSLAEPLFAANYQLLRQYGSTLEQLDAQMYLAYARAAQGHYEESEQTLITTILPGFKRLNNQVGRMQGLMTLASIYRLQKRYPEVQWFLLQAKEIAEQQKFNTHLADIIFHMAEAKNLSGNKQVAINEYLIAQELAEKNEWLAMQLAIQDALGDIYHLSGKYEDAARALYRYDALLDLILAEDYLIAP
jgi:hypothetical protein